MNLFQPVFDNAVEELQKTAAVHVLQHRAVVSLVGNTEMSSFILRMASNVLCSTGVKVQMITQGSSNSDVVKVSLVVHDSEAKDCVQALHSAFFENGYVSELERAENKRKAVDNHPEASTRQRTTTAEPSGPEETEPRLPEGDNGDLTEVFQSISDDNIPPVTGNHWDPSMCYADIERQLYQEMATGSDESREWTRYLSDVFDSGCDGEGPSGVGGRST